MESLAYIHAWLIWEEQEEQLEVPNIQISSISGLVILILILAPLIDLHPVLAAQLLAKGSRGESVRQVQVQLNEAGCLVKEDGVFGRETRAAVINFQKFQGLEADGVVGENTRNAFLDSETTCFLKLGSRGERVHQLQSQLNQAGFQVKEDGIFGRQTRAAVINFQKFQGLKRDGIFGNKTMKIISNFSLDWGKYNIPTLQKFNELKNQLQNSEKQYRAALELVQIWQKQKTDKSRIESYTNQDINLYDPLNPAIIVSLPAPKNKYQVKALQQEKLPIDVLFSIFDRAIEETDPRQQFIAALFRTYLLPKPANKVIEVLSKNLEITDLDSSYNKLEGAVVSIADEAIQELLIISNYYPQEITEYWKNNYYNNVSYYKVIQYSDNSSIQLLSNLAANGDNEALHRLKVLVQENPEKAYDIALAVANNGLEGNQKLQDWVVGILTEALSNPEQKAEAAAALGKFGIEGDQKLKDRVVKILKTSLSNEDFSAEAAALALAEINVDLVVNSLNINKDTNLDLAGKILAKIESKENQKLQKFQTEVVKKLSNSLKTAEPLKAGQNSPMIELNPSKLCALANIGKPSVQSLKQISQTSQNILMKKQIDWITSYIDNPAINYPIFITLCNQAGTGGDPIKTVDETVDKLTNKKQPDNSQQKPSSSSNK